MSPAHVPSNGTPAKKPQALQACPTRSGSPPTQPQKGELAVPAVPGWWRCRGRVLPSKVQYWGSRCAGGAQSAVCSWRPVRGRCRCRGGRTGERVKDALFGQICTSRSHFPRSLFLKVQICPNQSTHPAHAPDAPRSRPVLRCPTVQKTGRFTFPFPISPGHSPPKPKSAGFLYPPHQIAPTGRNAPAI